MQRIVLSLAAAGLAAAAAMSPALASNPAGRVERIAGDASRAADDGTVEALALGSVIYEGDTVATGDGARLRVRFSDTSSLQMGENAELLIDEMVHPSAEDTGSQAFEFATGVFRFISGSIAHADPDSVSLSTPVATIGIRGTNVVFGVLTVGMPEGQSHYGFQLWDGAVEITSMAGSVILDERGEGTFLPLTKIAAPTPTRQWKEDEAAEARDAVSF